MSMESLQRRIKTTQDLRDIVSTMKSLSSVSILQYDQAGIALEQYLKNILDAFHALIKADKIVAEAENLKRNVDIYKRRMKQMLSEQLEVVDKITDIEY